MKVLLLTWDFPPSRGGIQIWMHELARRLPAAPGDEVRVLAPAVPGDLDCDARSGLDVRRLGAAGHGRAAWLAQLTARTIAACVAWRPDLIVCGHVITAPAALAARRLTGVPYAVFTYGYEVRSAGRRRAIAHLLRAAPLVIACSQFTKSVVVGLGVPAERVRILYPGVDPDRYSPWSDRPGANHYATLLSVSRLAEAYKGHDTAIRALPLVQSRVPAARYYIAGQGPLQPYLEGVARSVGMTDSVVFLTRVSDDALRDLYRTADLLLLLARDSAADGGAEGFGIVCLEAAACGLPVVAGRSGGLPDAVADGVTGLLVDPTDLGAAADAIVSLLMDPGRARAMGAAGRKRVLERFTWEQMAAAARRLFAAVVAPRSP